MEDFRLTQILSGLRRYRGLILEATEQELEGSPRWPILRKRLLKYLGERGLETVILGAFGQTVLSERELEE